MPEPTTNNPTAAHPLPLAALPLLALLAACDGTGDDVVTGAAGTLGGLDVMVVAVTEDVFTVGSAMGDGWDVFGRVGSVHFDERGNLHIFDSQADHILVVGPDGSLIRTVGGRGEGPGEFGSVLGAIVARDGSYTVTGFAHVDLLDSSGEFVRRVTLDPRTTGTVIADQALPDGRLLTSMVMRLGDDQEAADAGRPIYVFPLDGTGPEVLYTAWELPEDGADESSIEGSPTTGAVVRMPAGRAFEPRLDFGLLSDGRVALIDSTGYRVKLVSPDGSVDGTIERPIAPLPVDDAIRDAARERFAASNQPSPARTDLPVRFERAGVEELDFADEVPVLRALAVDWEDRIWLARNGATGADDGPTEIVTPAGEYIGTLPPDGLRTPAAFGPDGLMAYIERDEMDVPSVRVVRLAGFEPGG